MSKVSGGNSGICVGFFFHDLYTTNAKTYISKYYVTSMYNKKCHGKHARTLNSHIPALSAFNKSTI